MRTNRSADEISTLPPPPAPTARDANPWPVVGAPGAPTQPRRTPSIRKPRGRDPATRPGRKTLRNLLVLGIVAFIIVTAVVEALQGGEAESLFPAFIPLFIMVIVFLGRMRKARRRDGEDSTAGSGER